MKAELLRVTQKIDVIEDEPESQQKDIYFSRVEDIGENTLLITPPFRKGFYLPPRIGRIVVARIVSDKVPYLFESTLLRYRSERIPLWELSKPVVFRKIQLREYVRLEINLQVELEISLNGGETKSIKTLTRNLSAGGALVALSQALPVGTNIRISIAVSSDFEFAAKGTIVRVVPPMLPGDRYFAGIQFADLDAATKQRIIRFIFSKQVEFRQKEKEWFR